MARGCTVVALTTSEWKVEHSILSLGADDSILMPLQINDHTNPKVIRIELPQLEKINMYKNKMTVIIDTIQVPHDSTYYIDMIKPHGILHVVGDMNLITTTTGRNIFWYNKNMAGSNVGGISDTIKMLDFCSKNNIQATGEMIDIKQVNEAVENMVQKKASYRYIIDLNTLQ